MWEGRNREWRVIGQRVVGSNILVYDAGGARVGPKGRDHVVKAIEEGVLSPLSAYSLTTFGVRGKPLTASLFGAG